MSDSTAVNETVPCQVCRTPTRMLGTKLCDRCWELKSRIAGDPQIARQILASIVPPAGDHIDIVFDAPPGAVCGRFIEVEDASGKNISIGEWVHRSDGYWALRITRAALP